MNLGSTVLPKITPETAMLGIERLRRVCNPMHQQRMEGLAHRCHAVEKNATFARLLAFVRGRELDSAADLDQSQTSFTSNNTRRCHSGAKVFVFEQPAMEQERDSCMCIDVSAVAVVAKVLCEVVHVVGDVWALVVGFATRTLKHPYVLAINEDNYRSDKM